MFIRTAPAGATNTIIDYLGTDYINFTSRPVGTTYDRFSVDVTADISSISTEEFVVAQDVTCDDTDYITDDDFNVYFKVIQYTARATSRPARV